MSKVSNYLENAILNHLLRNTSYTPPSTIYLALYTTDPTDADTGTEVSGGSYARQAITFNPASSRSTSNSATVTFPEATSDWGTISYWGLKDSLTGGNLLFYGTFSNPETINSGDQLEIGSGTLTVSFTGQVSVYAGNKLLDLILRGTSFTPPSTLYLALYTSNPTENDTGTEVSGNNYSRVTITFGSPSNGSCSNNSDVLFPVASGSWGTISYIGIRDNSSGGNLLIFGSTTVAKQISANNRAVFKTGNVVATVD